jgi:hypothetical protein
MVNLAHAVVRSQQKCPAIVGVGAGVYRNENLVPWIPEVTFVRQASEQFFVVGGPFCICWAWII